MVLHSLLLTHDRIKGFGVEVQSSISWPRERKVTTCLCSVAPKLATTGFANKIKTRSGVLHPYVLAASVCAFAPLPPPARIFRLYVTS
jgi:hypothetical protein